MVDGTGISVNTSEGTLSEMLRDSLEVLSSGERKVARTILANYPIAGLETAAELAARAKVSPPTVVRCVSRLGFSGYPEFQKRLMREVHERLGSPLEQYGRPDLRSGDGDLARAARVYSGSLAATISDMPESEFTQAIALLADVTHPVRLTGGRFSHVLADYLGAHLELLRPNVHVMGIEPMERLAAIADTRRGDVFAVFDYRRYDPQTVRFAQRVADRGARVVLFTDRWLSPAADVAAIVLSADVEAPSPFDSLVPAMAVVETLVAGVTDRLGESGRERVAAIEAMRDRTVAERT
ncbi:MurR/RpiR family transcriptional regulator [Microbacterium lacticum]|uniref:MurR/RpiR family transcriptional regulator n=1 Tax=Microbacterium lacticum TaxID=33885 RepID=UPI001F5AA8C9|nr:MurR/RpiR family transcriptional regulator [Microbacterium lacticum]